MSNFDSSPSCQVVIKMELFFQFKRLEACVCLSTSSSWTSIWCCFHQEKSRNTKIRFIEIQNYQITLNAQMVYNLSTKAIHSFFSANYLHTQLDSYSHTSYLLPTANMAANSFHSPNGYLKVLRCIVADR